MNCVAGKEPKSDSKIDFEMATAQVETGSGRAVWAKARLKRALATANKFGLAKNELECRLAMEQVAPGGGRSPESIERLGELEKEATNKGFILIARKGAEIR
jgi:hypothetical protein